MILSRYILKNHVVPFVFSNITLIFIFLLQFMMKFADRLIGKGLGVWVIIKLITFNLAWMVVLVVPMATLVSTLMAFGTMSQNNEITILKSSGISLKKMMAGPFIASIVVAYLLFLFNNDVLPDANHQAKILMEDISRQKPTLSLQPGVFSQDVANYAILAREIDKGTNELRNVVIYDYTNPTRVDVVTAQRGRIYFSKNQSKLIMDLWDGEIHESDVVQTNYYREIQFQKHRIIMNGDQFSFQQSAPGEPRGDRELSTGAMLTIIDSLNQVRYNALKNLTVQTNKYMLMDNASVLSPPNFPKSTTQNLLYLNALQQIRTAQNIIIANYRVWQSIQDEINSYTVEVHKKYALPVACIVFILIGAPLGVMVKKGGFGIAASISLFFFVVYWAFLIGGEKLADRNIITPFWGMWSANILLIIVGLLLTTKTIQETVTINFSALKKIIPKQWRSYQEESEEN
ncbi:MAG TPA: LptF/LptG family permease [Ignavibacteriaceae bacterium]|nr:LptF/LptG family permease [Ignavibacteriaceae bacterium]